MPRLALPQNYESRSSNRTLWQDFENKNDWGKANCTLENNTSQYVTGTQSIKMTVEPGGGGIMQLTGLSEDFSSVNKFIEIWIYSHNDLSKISNISMQLYTGGSTFIAYINSNYLIQGQWNRILVPRNIFNPTGSPDWTNITKFEIRTYAIAGQIPILSFDACYRGGEQDGRVIISFDDGYESVFTEAYSYMSTRGIKGTVYINPIWIDTSNYMTSANLDTLYDAGWAVANHTWSHPDLTTLTQAQVEDELLQCKEWLDARGYTRSSRHLAYPLNGYNNTVYAAMTASGIITGRNALEPYYGLPSDNKNIASRSMTSSLSLASAKVIIDNSIDFNTMICLHGHKLWASAGSGTWAIADFQALIDYCIERRAKVVTIDEFYEGLTNPRYTSTPPSRPGA